MTRLSINELTTYRWTFEEDVNSLVAAKIPAVGLWRQKLSDFGEEKAVELIRDSPLEVSCLLWAGGFTGSDGRGFRDAVDDAVEAIRLAGQLEARCLVVYTGARGGHTHNHARRLLFEAFKTLIPHAGEHGVCLALEPMHPHCASDWTFLTSLDDTLALVEKLNDKHVGMVFDSYHLGFDPHVLAKIPALVKHIKLVQLGDGKAPPGREQNRCLLGEGIVPLQEIVAALDAAGYDGDYDVELLGDDVADYDYPSLLEQTHAAYSRLRSR